MNVDEKVELLLKSLAAGDSIGVTSEFVRTCGKGLEIYELFKKDGWPFTPVGRGSFNIEKGGHSDDTDMAFAITKSYYQSGHKFNPNDIANEFVNWLKTDPKDIGNTTYDVLTRIAKGIPWQDASYEVYRDNKRGAANGSLMRNGVIPAICNNMDEVFEYSTIQGLITHYAPLPVLTCCVQSWVIMNLFDNKWPLASDWQRDFAKAWVTWLNNTTNEDINEWASRVGKEEIENALKEILNMKVATYEGFNPFTANYENRAGYCLLTLQVALWALFESTIKKSVFRAPEGYPKEVFSKKGPWVLGWLALIGWDADTYMATAGPVLAAKHGRMPESMTQDLQINERWNKLEKK